MQQVFRPGAAALAVAALFPTIAEAADGVPAELDAVVVTAPAMAAPLATSFDPKAPQQPLPANDGASFLKAIPGMSVVRKGGTDGDPVFRGMAASRLNILLDGEMILGGCGGRMDPPTAYVFPETYDRVTLLKGPQTVVHGPGNSAGTVLFERKASAFAEPGWKFNGSLMGGSFGRHDEVADFQGGNAAVYFRGAATASQADDYRDGDGNKVHSRYERWSANAAVGLTPDRGTRLEFSAIRSDAKAAYADRSMDGAKFERDNYGVKFEKKNLSPLFEKVEAQAYYNYIDHVMDNFSLRPRVGMAMLSNPDRKTTGGRIAATLRPGDSTRVTLGVDSQDNVHTLRNSLAARRVEDAHFSNTGVFGELTRFAGPADRLIAGLRVDGWQARDSRSTGATAVQHRAATLNSGFARYEHDYAAGRTAYVGVAHSERFPDYWELISQGKQSETTGSAFRTRPEKTKQLDVGTIVKSGAVSLSVSGFYSRIDDFILIDSRYPGKVGTYVTRNADATTWGGEAGVGYAWSAQWKADASLAYVHGSNDTDHRALGQIPPLEGRFGLNWDNRVWSAGTLLRLVAGQHHNAWGQGSIVGQDQQTGAGGFGVLSVNAGYRPQKGVLIAAGVDNLFDKTYAEQISRAGAMVAGFDQTTRVNEPGRNFWLKASLALD